MTININALRHATKNLPVADEVNQRMQIRLSDVVTVWTKIEDDIHPVEVFNLIAVKYCRSEYDCWIEWELDL